MRPLIAYLFIFLFSLQIIPIKEIGEILYKGQVTEEEVNSYGHTTDDGTPKLKKDSGPVLSVASQNQIRITCLDNLISTAILQAEKLPPPFVPDILTPPPNNRP